MHNHNQAGSAEIRFEQVSVHYWSRSRWLGGKVFKALDNLNLVVDTNNLAIVGPSGAGKSTLIELLFGLRQPTSGEVFVCGFPLSICSAEQRQQLCKHIQLIPQEPQSSLNPYFTVYQILLEPLKNLGLLQDVDKKIKQALCDVGLNLALLQAHAQQLSVGQAQRVAIARALIVEPCVLVADEPTSSLDPVSRQQILNLLKHLQESRCMRLILVTHDLSAAQALCDEVLVLEHGEVVDHQATENITINSTHSMTQALLNAQNKHHQFTRSNTEIVYEI